jgi:flavorubredoxin
VPIDKEPDMQSDDVLAGVPATEPEQIAPETWLIPNLFPAGDGLFVPVNTMLIRGAEPVIVDTGAPVHRELWLEKVFSLVEPEDVRWIFLSHDDGDHTGGLLDAMALCPQATLVTNFFSVERLALEKPALPLGRMRWIDEGGTLDAGDRTLRLFKPPIFDGPTTRGLFDPTTAAMWIVDSFACLTPGTLDVHEMPTDLVAESMPAMNSLVSPWHQWLDPTVYRRHVDEVEALGVLAVASAHGPVVTGDAIREAFEVIRRLAGQPVIPAPGQDLLDDLITQVLAA